MMKAVLPVTNAFGFLSVGFGENPRSTYEMRVAPHQEGRHRLWVLEAHEPEHSLVLAWDPHVTHRPVLPKPTDEHTYKTSPDH